MFRNKIYNSFCCMVASIRLILQSHFLHGIAVCMILSFLFLCSCEKERNKNRDNNVETRKEINRNRNNNVEAKLELEYPDDTESVDLLKVLKKTEESLQRIDVTAPYLDDDTLFFEYILAYYMQLRVQDEKNPMLELIWRRTQSRERRVMILLVHYPYIGKSDLYPKGRPEYRNLQAWSGKELKDRLYELDFIDEHGSNVAKEIDRIVKSRKLTR